MGAARKNFTSFNYYSRRRGKTIELTLYFAGAAASYEKNRIDTPLGAGYSLFANSE
jgi:hypothetical protein